MTVPTGTSSARAGLLVGEAEHVDGDDGLAERRVQRVHRVEHLAVLGDAVRPQPGARVDWLVELVEPDGHAGARRVRQSSM